MKAKILIAVALLFCFGCTSQESKQLSQQEKDQIKTEVKAVLDNIFAKAEKLDPEGALQYYSPELVQVSDGALNDYQAIKKAWIEMNDSAASWKWTTVRWDFNVLTKDLVISTWVGKMEYVAKSGDKMTIDPMAYTDICKKIDGQWKVIYEQPSGNAVIQKAGKK